MNKSKIYTRGGDKGQTSLVSGTRISKGDLRIELYGEVDEMNSFLGSVCSKIEEEAELSELNSYLEFLQSRLFDLGSNLACEKVQALKYKLPIITDEIIKELEFKIDEMDSELVPLKNFILPGGHKAAAEVHIVRTICRRIERKLVRFEEEHTNELPENCIQFINRLSDYFFVLARFINKKMNRDEVIWKKEN